MSSFYPQLVAAEWRAMHPGFAPVNSACCCGTKEGTCCGRACCQIPGKSENSPVTPVRSSYQSEPLGFWNAAGDSIHPPAGSDAILAETSARTLSGRLTLVELSIRINT
ncbi:MAG: hypothetical protein AB7O26_15965 [Planctomycetaceae bacterium]